jgi:SAM-dependent methyltransferase
MPSIRWNRKWNRYEWPRHGEEWSGQAEYCNQPYEAWKSSIFETFIEPYVSPSGTSLEIGCGHGRWSPYLIDRSARVVLVDLNPDCVAHCRERFSDRDHVEYLVTDGSTIPLPESASVGFVWSYDSFVHMEADVILSYFREFARLLEPGGTAVIHHAGRRHAMLRLSFVAKWGRPGKGLYRLVSMKWNTAGGRDGDRGMISSRRVRELAREAGLSILFQVDSWGDRGQFDCKRFNDVITGLRKPIGDEPTERPGS